jgi:hypothetical protein
LQISRIYLNINSLRPISYTHLAILSEPELVEGSVSSKIDSTNIDNYIDFCQVCNYSKDREEFIKMGGKGAWGWLKGKLFGE